MRRFRKATIKDVAQRAGVSTTTVSVFVSGRENVCSPETAARIRDAVNALNYTPSSLISGAQKKVMQTIGVSMENPVGTHLLFGSMFFARLWRGISAEADARNYSLLHYPGSVRQDDSRIDPYLDGRVDGIIFHAHTNSQVSQVAAAGMPLVLVTRSLDLPPEAGAVWADEDQTAEVALSYLWAKGHRRIAHVAGPLGGERQSFHIRGSILRDDIAIRRFQGYENWIRQHDAYAPDLIAYAQSWQEQRIPEIVAGWRQMSEPPTAVLCANDVLALAVIREAEKTGWRVPEDLAVVGVDNTPEGLDSSPKLTSVDVCIEDVAREAVRCLFRLMEGAPMEECRVALPVSTLVERASA